MKKCPHCGKEHKEENQFCTVCGARLEAEPAADTADGRRNPSAKKKAAPIAVVAAGLVLLVCVAVFFASGDKTPPEAYGQDPIPGVMDGNQPGAGTEALAGEAKLQAQEQENINLQANINNFGLVVRVGNDICFSDLGRGLYLCDENYAVRLLAQGYYYDLVKDGKELYCIEKLDSAYDVVRINLESGEKQVLHEVPGTTRVVAANMLDDKYYFLVDKDQLFYLDLKTDQIVSTEYRNVAMVGLNGVFSTDDSRQGLSYTSFDGEETQNYSELSGKKVWVIYAGRETAAIVVFDGPTNQHSEFYTGLLDIHTGEIKNKITRDELEGYTYEASINVVPGQDRYLLSVIEQQNDKLLNCLYFYDPKQNILKKVDSFDSEMVTLGVMVVDQTAYMVDPGSETQTMFLYDISGGMPVKKGSISVQGVSGSTPESAEASSTEAES